MTKSACSTDDESIQWKHCSALGSTSAVDITGADQSSPGGGVAGEAGVGAGAVGAGSDTATSAVPATSAGMLIGGALCGAVRGVVLCCVVLCSVVWCREPKHEERGMWNTEYGIWNVVVL